MCSRCPSLLPVKGLILKEKNSDSGLNHHDTKAHELRTRQTFRLSEFLNSCRKSRNTNEPNVHIPFHFLSTDSDSICPKWIVLKGNLGYRPGFVLLQGIPLLSGPTDDKIRCPVCLRQRLEERDQVRDV